MDQIPATVTVSNIASKTGILVLSVQMSLSTLAIIWAIKKK